MLVPGFAVARLSSSFSRHRGALAHERNLLGRPLGGRPSVVSRPRASYHGASAEGCQSISETASRNTARLSGVSQAGALEWTSVDPPADDRLPPRSRRTSSRQIADDRPPVRFPPLPPTAPTTHDRSSGHTARTVMFPDAFRRPRLPTAIVVLVAFGVVAATLIACSPPREVSPPTPASTIAALSRWS